MRIIFFAGKGGVGKTSVAAASAVKAAESGKKTILMSLDAAHSITDVFVQGEAGKTVSLLVAEVKAMAGSAA